MATRTPVSITGSWTKVYDGLVSGAFSGGIQANDNSNVLVFVTTGDVAPSQTGGFVLGSGSSIYPIAVAATECLWAKAVDGSGSVVMG
jgi:hypothetical protein